MKTPLIFLIVDILLVFGYGLTFLANFTRRIFSRRSKA